MNTIEAPPFYPARPIPGGRFDPCLLPLGDRRYECKANGWRSLVRNGSRAMFNRYLEPLSITEEFVEALTLLEDAYPDEPWIDVEAMDRRHGLLRGALLVLDLPCQRGTYLQRRAIIETATPTLPYLPVGNDGRHKLYHLPSFKQDQAATMYAAYQDANELLGVPLYEGLVSKKADSLYPQDSKQKDYPGWIKYRFLVG